jgi:hypothetical protein
MAPQLPRIHDAIDPKVPPKPVRGTRHVVQSRVQGHAAPAPPRAGAARLPGHAGTCTVPQGLLRQARAGSGAGQGRGRGVAECGGEDC